MQKNPFNRNSDKFLIKPHLSSLDIRDVVAKKLLNTYFGYWGTFALWLIVSWNFIPTIFMLVALMWISGGIAAIKIPTEANKIAHKTRFTILSYIVGLLAWRFVLNIILTTPIEVWEKTFMMSLSPAFATAFIGFISMSFIVAMFMGFVGYLNYIFQLFMFHRAGTKTEDFMNAIMRRE